MLKAFFTPYLWMLPFICFIIGYISCYTWYPKTVCVPHVVGMPVHDALATLSGIHANCILQTSKPDAQLPAGTVIAQEPAAGTKIRPRQTVFITTVTKPVCPQTPCCIGFDQASIERLNSASGITTRFFELPSPQPAHTCIAQIPHPGTPLETPFITCYIAQSSPQLYVWPDFIGTPLSDACSQLCECDISPHIVDSVATTSSTIATVTDQRPLPGAIVKLDASLASCVYLQI